MDHRKHLYDCEDSTVYFLEGLVMDKRLRHTCADPAGELVEESCAACEDLSVSEWVQERYDNCIRLAAEKSGSDKDGWLNDAEYFRLIVLRLSSNFSPKLDDGVSHE